MKNAMLVQFYKDILTLTPERMNNYTHYKIWDEITWSLGMEK